MPPRPHRPPHRANRPAPLQRGVPPPPSVDPPRTPTNRPRFHSVEFRGSGNSVDRDQHIPNPPRCHHPQPELRPLVRRRPHPQDLLPTQRRHPDCQVHRLVLNHPLVPLHPQRGVPRLPQLLSVEFHANRPRYSVEFRPSIEPEPVKTRFQRGVPASRPRHSVEFRG